MCIALPKNSKFTPKTMMNIGALKFGGSQDDARHADMLEADGVQCNQYKTRVDGYTRMSIKYLFYEIRTNRRIPLNGYSFL